MGTPLSVLVVEDSEDDTALLLYELQCGGYDPAYARVETAAEMQVALEKQTWDLVISDHSMPCFDAPAALTLLQQGGLDIPFIIVSGAIGEDRAVNAMKAGAHDYIMKDNLARLTPAIERELREAEMRRERKGAERTLREIRDAERRRIARDLHDVVMQDLVYALQMMRINHIRWNDAGLNVDLQEEIDALQRSVQGLRNAVYNLRLEGLEEQPFLECLESLVELIRQMAPGCEIKLVVSDRFPSRLPGAVGMELLRIIQEALANARRHSAAQCIQLTLDIEGDELRAEVADNGRGFEPEGIWAQMGLTVMQERAMALDGSLEVRSGFGKGTRVTVRVPAPPQVCAVPTEHVSAMLVA